MRNDDEIKKLVIARLEVLPKDRKVSIGNEGSFTRDELIQHVSKEDKIGKKMIEIEMEFLRSLKTGII
jgi:hypothetical protein